jgi:hypothetical protein
MKTGDQQLKVAAFLGVTLYSLVEMFRRFRRTCYLPRHGSLDGVVTLLTSHTAAYPRDTFIIKAIRGFETPWGESVRIRVLEWHSKTSCFPLCITKIPVRKEGDGWKAIAVALQDESWLLQERPKYMAIDFSTWEGVCIDICCFQGQVHRVARPQFHIVPA